MRKKGLWMTAALTAALGAAWLLSPGKREEPRQADTVVLSDYGGMVAVYHPGESAVPRQITAIEVRFLPGIDQTQLHRGIPVEDGAPLAMLLEDLGE